MHALLFEGRPEAASRRSEPFAGLHGRLRVRRIGPQARTSAALGRNDRDSREVVGVDGAQYRNPCAPSHEMNETAAWAEVSPSATVFAGRAIATTAAISVLGAFVRSGRSR